MEKSDWTGRTLKCKYDECKEYHTSNRLIQSLTDYNAKEGQCHRAVPNEQRLFLSKHLDRHAAIHCCEPIHPYHDLTSNSYRCIKFALLFHCYEHLRAKYNENMDTCGLHEYKQKVSIHDTEPVCFRLQTLKEGNLV
jgi:hypothetical protein